MWTVRKGVEQLYEAYAANMIDEAEFLGNKYLRIKTIQRLQDEGSVDDRLRWRAKEPVKG